LWTTPRDQSPTFGASGAVFRPVRAADRGHGVRLSPSAAAARVAADVQAALRRRGAFLLYNLLTDHVGTASELAGLATGLFAGLVLARRVMVRKPHVRRAVLVPASVAMVALVSAVPLRGTIDARPATRADCRRRVAESVEYGRAVTEYTQGAQVGERARRR
jgi:hypothetical protein